MSFVAVQRELRSVEVQRLLHDAKGSNVGFFHSSAVGVCEMNPYIALFGMSQCSALSH